MTLHTPTAAPIDPAWLAELTAELAGYGYKVTKARAPRGTSTETRGTSTEPAPIGPKLVTKAPKGHGACAAHWRVPGMRKPVCIVPAGSTIREDGRDTGELVPAEWTDADTVLAFAVDCAERIAEHRTRASVGYTGADQSGADLGLRSTYDAEKARKVDEARRMRKVPHAFAPRQGYAYATECETCTGAKHADVHRADETAA